MSTGYSASRRPGTAYAAAIAARQRRQLIFAITLVVILIGVLAWEIPHLHLFGGHKSAFVAPLPVAPAPTPGAQKTLQGLRKTAASDPFSAPVAGDAGSSVRDVATPAGSVDPFAASLPGGGKAAVVASPLPNQLVIGSPGAGRVPTHGWIVILASIPTGEGRAAATSFASKVERSGIGSVQVLNSSNRRPLRGGYWVVYLGPYATVDAVSSLAASVHGAGFPTAYIRELIVYR
jgi:hypothetical protein